MSKTKAVDFINELINEEMSYMIFESVASKQARSMGLSYGGFGRWINKAGKLIAQTKNGKLLFKKNKGGNNSAGTDDITFTGGSPHTNTNTAITGTNGSSSSAIYNSKTVSPEHREQVLNHIRSGAISSLRYIDSAGNVNTIRPRSKISTYVPMDYFSLSSNDVTDDHSNKTAQKIQKVLSALAKKIHGLSGKSEMTSIKSKDGSQYGKYEYLIPEHAKNQYMKYVKKLMLSLKVPSFKIKNEGFDDQTNLAIYGDTNAALATATESTEVPSKETVHPKETSNSTPKSNNLPKSITKHLKF